MNTHSCLSIHSSQSCFFYQTRTAFIHSFIHSIPTLGMALQHKLDGFKVSFTQQIGPKFKCIAWLISATNTCFTQSWKVLEFLHKALKSPWILGYSKFNTCTVLLSYFSITQSCIYFGCFWKSNVMLEKPLKKKLVFLYEPCNMQKFNTRMKIQKEGENSRYSNNSYWKESPKLGHSLKSWSKWCEVPAYI